MIDDAGSSGTLLLSATYDAFGEEYASPTTYYTDAYDGFGAQWGYFQDQSENLELLGHRFYDQVNGRFINRDPTGYADSPNLYTYADDMPTRAIDPSGTQTIIVPVEPIAPVEPISPISPISPFQPPGPVGILNPPGINGEACTLVYTMPDCNDPNMKICIYQCSWGPEQITVPFYAKCPKIGSFGPPIT
jgi:RHS repeat-associated protein